MRQSTKASVRLSRKDRAILWVIACWFNEPVSGQLKEALYPGDMVAKLAKQYDRHIEDRIIELGKYLSEKRAEEQINHTRSN